MVDLHLHSVFSDGTETPEELVALGSAAGLTALALTDHDTLEGCDRFLRAASEAGMRAVTGVEISVEVPGHEVHVLAYGIDPGHPGLRDALESIRKGRQIRNRKIVERLQALGYKIDMDDLRREAGADGVAGRPHIAQALIRAGYVPNKAAAFDSLLKRGAPAYADRLRLNPAMAMGLIHAAGGVGVLAHPHLLGLSRGDLHDFVKDLRRAGLDGLEAYHSEHPYRVVRALLGLAADLGLFVTGGSDFHTSSSANFRIGVGFGNLRVPDECFDKLSQAIAERRLRAQAGPAKASTTPSATAE